MTSTSKIFFKRKVSLAALTTFQVGTGRADYCVEVSRSTDLVRIVRLARELKIPFRVIAGGSNIVFGDQDYHGLLVRFLASRKNGKNNLEAKISSELEKLKNKNKKLRTVITAPASLPLADLIKHSIKHSLAGLEALSGIPGTVGGALAGNAGAYGQSISDKLTEVEVFDGKKIRWIKKSACQFAYRNSAFKHEKRGWLILRARFNLKSGEKKILLQKSREIIKIRSAKYKPGLKCPGSFFKNVLVEDISKQALGKIDKTKIRDGKIPAGYLLEEVGACGLKQGKIAVASFHGNLLYNRGGGKTKDVKILAEKLKKLVWKKFRIKLEEEVKYLT